MARPRRRRTPGITCLVAAMWAAPIIPPAYADEAAAPVRRTVSSGTRVAVLPRPGGLMVAIDIRVRGGSADGPEGVAHAVEHMVFKGTTDRASGEIDASMERLGGEIEARTFRDSTRFSVVLPRAAWRDGLSLLSELLSRPALRDEDWAVERRVIEEERAWSQADPGSFTTQALIAALWPDSAAMAAPPIGEREKVAMIDAGVLRAFHARWYRGERLSVVVAGDVDADDVVSAAEAFFHGPKAVELHRPAPPAPSPGARRSLPKPLPAAPVVSIGWRIDGTASQVGALAAVGAEWLADEQNGPFAPLLAGDNGPAVAISVERLPQRDATLLIARLVARPGRDEALARDLTDRLEMGFANPTISVAEEARKRASARWDAEWASPNTAARLASLYEGLDRPGDERLVRKAIDIVDSSILIAFLVRLGHETPLAVSFPKGSAR